MRLHALFFLLLVSCLSSASGFSPTVTDLAFSTETAVESIDIKEAKKIEKIEKQQEEIIQQQIFIMNQVDLINSRIEKVGEKSNGK